VPVLRSKDAAGRKAWLYEHYPVYPIPIPGIAAVRTDTHKYITYQNNVRKPEIFDIANDPKEMLNLLGTPQGNQLHGALKNELEKVKSATGYVENWSTKI